MADGDDSTQNGQQGNQTPEPDTSKIFSKGYNEGIETQEKRVLNKFSEVTGQEFASVDDLYGWAKNSSQKLAESVSDPTQTEEYKTLQKNLNEYKNKFNEAQSMVAQVQNQYKFDNIHGETVNKMRESSEFVIPESDAKDLFKARYSVDWKDGNAVVKKGDTPVLDEEGNYKPLQSVLSDFYKNYTKPSTQGTGGSTGDGGDMKPSYKEFQQANMDRDYEKVQSLFDQASNAGGWKEKDAPAI